MSEKLITEIEMLRTCIMLEHKEKEQLEQENQKLQRRIDVFDRAKRIWDRRSSGEYSDLNDASQEAAHYCWLDEQNEKLTEALQEAVEALNVYSSDLDIEICEACSECVSDLYLVENTLPDLEPEDFGHKARQALSKIKSLGIVKEGE